MNIKIVKVKQVIRTLCVFVRYQAVQTDPCELLLFLQDLSLYSEQTVVNITSIY